jgi:hypothetical protein
LNRAARQKFWHIYLEIDDIADLIIRHVED